jgi:hypothetical protein
VEKEKWMGREDLSRWWVVVGYDEAVFRQWKEQIDVWYEPLRECSEVMKALMREI